VNGASRRLSNVSSPHPRGRKVAIFDISIYDRVELKNDNGMTQRLTREAYEKLPMSQRTRAILKNQVRFFKGDREIHADEVFGIGK